MGSPLDDETQDARRKAPLQHTQRGNFDGRLVAPITGMEMRWIVLIVKHGDNDAEESADLWHGWGILQQCNYGIRFQSAAYCPAT
jgi:hypothetical protein